MYHEKYQRASNLGANVPDVHLPLKPGGDHQQSLQEDVDEGQLHHHETRSAIECTSSSF